MKLPDCTCFAGNNSNGENIAHTVAAYTVQTFRDMCVASHVCPKAARFVAVTAIINIIDLALSVEKSSADGTFKQFTSQEARALFDAYVKDLPAELIARRDQVDAQLAAIDGVSIARH